MLPICPVCTTLGPSLADRIRCPIVQSYQQEEHRRKLDVILFINTQMEWNQGGKGTGIGIQLYSDFLRIGQVRFLFKKIRDEPTLREFDSSARGRQQRRRLLRRDRTSATNCTADPLRPGKPTLQLDCRRHHANVGSRGCGMLTPFLFCSLHSQLGHVGITSIHIC